MPAPAAFRVSVSSRLAVVWQLLTEDRTCSDNLCRP
jgi:hypothetical protein